MKKRGPINVIIVDDHEIIREAMSRMVDDAPKIKVIGLAKDGKEAINLVKQLKPHVVLMDIQMPHMDGINAAKKILKQNKKVKVIIFTALEKKDYLEQAMEIGAKGYLTKSAPSREIRQAIQIVFEGGQYFNYKPHHILTPVVLSSLNQRLFSQLSSKEEEVFNLVVQGYDTHDIAKNLNRDERTVRMHREHIRKKLDVETDVQLVLLVAKAGFPLAAN